MSDKGSEQSVLKDWLLKKMDYRMIWKKRFFILSGNQLIYYRNISDTRPGNIYYLDDTYRIVDYPPSGNIHQFAIYQGGQRLLWLATNDINAKLWISQIQNQISKFVYQKSTTNLNKTIPRPHSLSENELSLHETLPTSGANIPSHCLELFSALCNLSLDEGELIKAEDGCLFYLFPKNDNHSEIHLCNTYINSRIEYIQPLLMDYKKIKRHWSPSFFSGDLVETLNDNVDIIHYIFKPLTILLSPIYIHTRYLDACFIRYWTCVDQTYYIVMSSVTHPLCPLYKQYQRIYFSAGYKIEPVDSGKVSISQMVSYYPNGIATLFPGISRLLCNRLLSSTPGLACYLSQIPDYHIYAVIESLRESQNSILSQEKSEGICLDYAVEKLDENSHVTYISNTIPHVEDSQGDSYWEECTSVTWKVRGPTYMDTHEKITSQPGYCQILSVDLFKSDRKIEHIASYSQYSIFKIQEYNLDFPEGSTLFIVNLQMTIITPVSISFMFMIPPSFPEDPQSLNTFKTYLNAGKEFKDSRFKMIPTIEEGGFIIRKAVGTTPVLLGKKGSAAYYTGTTPYPYFEVDFDMDSNTVAKNLSKMMFGNTKSMVMDLAFLIQGEAMNELPERIMGSVRLVHLDMNEAQTINHK